MYACKPAQVAHEQEISIARELRKPWIVARTHGSEIVRNEIRHNFEWQSRLRKAVPNRYRFADRQELVDNTPL
jgi:hypothetical protein